jgi:anti-sigma B factor antagonist
MKCPIAQVRSGPEWIRIIDISGVLDMNTAPIVERTLSDLIRRGYHHLVISFRDAERLDCCGLRALLDALQVAREHNGSITLTDVPSRFFRLLEITAVGRVFHIVPTESEAVETARQHVHLSDIKRAGRQLLYGPESPIVPTA